MHVRVKKRETQEGSLYAPRKEGVRALDIWMPIKLWLED
jgi:hypothetical protein